MEAEKKNVLSTIERVFKAELLKITPALQSTLIGDLISGNGLLPLKSRLNVSVGFSDQTMSVSTLRGRGRCQ